VVQTDTYGFLASSAQPEDDGQSKPGVSSYRTVVR
jgi:hypothetical protein